MAVRRIVRMCVVLLAGMLGCAVTLSGIFSALAVDVHFNPVLSILYCALPILSLPLFLLAFVFRKLIALQAIFAVAYLGVYSALNWRTCASLDYCGSVASTVLMTLRAPSALSFFAVAILGFAATFLDRKQAAVVRAEK